MIRCVDHDITLDANGNCPLCKLLDELESLRQENSRLRADIGNLQVVNRTANEHIEHEADEHDKLVASLNAELKRLREALKRIAKPALGGKEQQWMAQQALKEPPKS